MSISMIASLSGVAEDSTYLRTFCHGSCDPNIGDLNLSSRCKFLAER